MEYEVRLMKKVLFLVFFFCIFPKLTFASIDIQSKNAILFHVNDASILYEKNSEEVISIASLTKIMTAIVAIENIADLHATVTLTSEDFAGLYEANASVAGFKIGEVVSYQDLLYGLLFPSGADAGQALTRLLGGREHFLFLMNEKAKDLGLENTQFKNETGLEEEGHYSTVKDVATFFLYALENSLFQVILTTSSYTTSNGRLTFQSTLESYRKKYSLSPEYLLGGKTGWTTEAGHCLATFAYQNGTSYLLVTAGAPGGASHLEDAKTLYDYFIEHYQKTKVLEKGELLLDLPISFGFGSRKFYSEKNIYGYLPKDYSKDSIQFEYSGISKIPLWTKSGTKLGNVRILYQDQIIDILEIRLEESQFPVFFLFSIFIFLFFSWLFWRKKNRKEKKNMI